MNDRAVEFTDMQKGIMRDWKLVFNKRKWRGGGVGFANIVPEYGFTVEGIIYKINENTIQTLDGLEGVPKGYHKKSMLVENINKEFVDCTVYIANHSRTNNSSKPKKEYLGRLLKGKEFLSENYFSELKNTKTFD